MTVIILQLITLLCKKAKKSQKNIKINIFIHAKTQFKYMSLVNLDGSLLFSFIFWVTNFVFFWGNKFLVRSC